MAKDFHTYDAANHTVTFGPIIMEGGFGPDTFIEVSRESPAWSDEVGVDGEVTRSKTNDDRATATLTLMQSSKNNDLLSAAYNLDKSTKGGTGAVPFTLVDHGGTTKIDAFEAWLQKSPDQSRARAIGATAWEIRLASIKEFHGGNDA